MFRNLMFCCLLTVLALFLLSPSAPGAIVASWDLTGDPGDQATQPAAYSAVGIAGDAMVRGAGLGAPAGVGVNIFNSNDWNDEVDEYIAFGFTVLPGFSVDLANLMIGTRSSTGGPGTMGLYSSVDNFASALYTFDQTVDSSGATPYVSSIIDLTALPTLGPGSFVVRLIEIGDTRADGSGATTQGGQFRVGEHRARGVSTDVQFNGTISAIPEMSAFVVWGLLIACGSMKVRRLSLA